MRRTVAIGSGLVALAVVAAAAIGIRAGETPSRIRVIYTNNLTGYLKACP